MLSATNPERPTVVTGASGFIGSHLIDALVEDGREVIGIDIRPPHCEYERYRFAEADIRRPLPDLGATETWYHLAALASPWLSVEQPEGFERTNVQGTLNVLEAAEAGGAHGFVFASTSSLYGEVAAPFRASEDWPVPSDVSPYGRTKQLGEHLIEAYAGRAGWQGGIVRFGNVYGPRQDPSTEAGVIGIFITALVGDKPLVVRGEGGVRDFVFVKDAVRALMHLGDTSAIWHPHWRGTMNVGTGGGTSVWEILRLLEDMVGKRADLRREPCRNGEVGRIVLDTLRAHDEGWDAEIAMAEGLRETIDWFRSIGGV